MVKHIGNNKAPMWTYVVDIDFVSESGKAYEAKIFQGPMTNYIRINGEFYEVILKRAVEAAVEMYEKEFIKNEQK